MSQDSGHQPWVPPSAPAPTPSSYGRFERRSEEGPGLRDRLTGGTLNLALIAAVLALIGGMLWVVGSWWFGDGEEPDGVFVEARDARVGDCVPSMAEGDVYVVDVVDCEDPHYAEAYAQFTLPDGSWPGDARVEELGYDGCAQRFEAFVGRPVGRSDLEFFPLLPTVDSWGDGREVVCWVALPGGERATDTLRGADR